MFEPPATGTLTMKKIHGRIPGILDPTQANRLLRIPGSTLSFASFDPRTAFTQDVPDLHNLSIKEELYRPKRVVVETAPGGQSTWRFVPSARKDDDVIDEGEWPRVIEICGEIIECSQDQWDIYKLDPLYECYVKAYPNLTVISRVEMQKTSPSSKGPKRRVISPSPDRTGPSLKTRRTRNHGSEHAINGDTGGEESEVEEMIVDDVPPRAKSAGFGEKAKKFREELERNRKDRREKVARRAERLGRQEEGHAMFSFSSGPAGDPQAAPSEPAGKRKMTSLFDSLRTNGDSEYVNQPEDDGSRNSTTYVASKRTKRTRTVSPSSGKRDLESKRLEREKQRRVRREKELNAWRQARDARFMNELYAEFPNADTNGATGHHHTRSPSLNEEVSVSPLQESTSDSREASIAESRRKLAELEADRPLWEAAAKNRLAQEKAEKDAERARLEAKQRAALQAEAEHREKALRSEQDAENRERARRKEREEIAQRERERRQRHQRWSYGPWTEKRALERYKTLSESFDVTRFSIDEPLTADCVPWPVLQSPVMLSLEDVSWASVEKFFEVVRGHMRSQHYKIFVEKSHRRFHPDRWRSRSLLKSVADEAERGCMEVAANTVAQALTPLWQEITGRA